MKKRALLSVSNKENLVEFAKGLVELGYEIISTGGGTFKVLQDANIDVIAVDKITGFPEILDGRVKTLHPKIHGGLLAKRGDKGHEEQLTENGIDFIDLVAVNLYPFKETVARKDASADDIIENIDIGGPTMLRAAAKNFESVIVVVDPSDYDSILTSLQKNELSVKHRKQLAAKVFRHTAQYDAMIASYFNVQTNDVFPESYTVTYEKVQTLRYGENPHQQAAFYKDPYAEMTLSTAKQLHGKELSFNNIQDANAAIEIIAEYNAPTVAVVKHMNPCGIGQATNLSDAFEKAYEADPISIFGGIIACNREVDQVTAEQMSKLFLEIIIAPKFTKGALETLSKKKNIRLLEFVRDEANVEENNHKISSVNGGVLIQSYDNGNVSSSELQCPTKRRPSDEEMEDLLFAWRAAKHVKSNAIVLAKDCQTIGIGAGQMNRIAAAEIAIKQAGVKAEKSVLASDAFFPMPDTVEAAAKAGVTAIIQPGGSNKDQDSIDACNTHGIAMVYTNMRHFKH